MKKRSILLSVIYCLLMLLTSYSKDDKKPPVQEDPIDQDAYVYKTPINQWVESGDIVGAEILIIKSGKILVHEAAGLRDIDRDLSFKKNTICRIRSMTKPIVGTSILMLMEEGKLLLSDKASKYLPAFNNDKCRDITIEQLLKHTGGFGQPGYPGWAGDYYNLHEVVQALANSGPRYTPGSRFSYSDGGSSALAEIVTVVSGMQVEEFIQIKIFTPLGMDDSFCVISVNDERRSRISCTYQGQSNNWTKYWDNYDPPQVPYFRGSGGVFSTAVDYSAFLSMWMNNGYWNSTRLLSAETVAMALTPSSESIQANKPFGLHWEIYDDPVFIHAGSDGTLGYADPSDDLLVLYFTQSNGNETLYRILSVVDNVLSNNPN